MYGKIAQAWDLCGMRAPNPDFGISELDRVALELERGNARCDVIQLKPPDSRDNSTQVERPPPTIGDLDLAGSAIRKMRGERGDQLNQIRDDWG